MEIVSVVLFSALAGYGMAMISVFFGAWLTCKAMAGKNGTLPFVSEPKGDVFTIEDTDGEPFPEEEGVENEEHILERTNKFLQTLGGSK